METSTTLKVSYQPLPSPDGLHVASITSNRLQIRSARSLDVFRSISLPIDDNAKVVSLRWSRISKLHPWSYRILLADGDAVHVWDLRDARWAASIDNGSGGMGKIISADFGATLDEVLIFSDFCSKLNVWNVATRRSVEIKDPKYSTNRGYAFRPALEEVRPIMALLSRPGPQDMLTLHTPCSYKVLKSVSLTTHDAQGFKWSPDGRWMAIWDSPSVGYRILVYAADGNLYRAYSGDGICTQELGLGVKAIEWNPKGDYLAVGGHDRRVAMLSTRTFSPAVVFEHTPTIESPETQVWQECVSASSERTYAIATQPLSPPVVPASSSDQSAKLGISILSFNVDGTLLATKDEAVPTAVWIWDLTSFTPRTILLQHSPVKKVSWHPSRADLLLIQCVHDEPLAYLWSASTDSPMVLSAPLERPFLKTDCNWIMTKQEGTPAIMMSNSCSFVLLWPDGRDNHPGETEPQETDEGDLSFDSVIEMLAGRTPLPDQMATTEWDDGIEDSEEFTETVFEDTFRGKRPLGLV